MTDISAQLREQILNARQEKRALAIQGGGSKHFMGRISDGEPLDVAPHRGILSYQPVELVLTARAGTPLAEVEAALEEQGQMLAFEPPQYSPTATLGGTLACHLSGPGRPWSGSIRDHVLGIGLINGRGEALRFGGQVMKNVAGYDLSRLQAGAMGSLGLITEISLKVLPRPAFTRTLVEKLPMAAAIVRMNTRAGEPKPLSAACWLDGKLYLRLSGARSAVEATARQWSGEVLENADVFWRQLRDQRLDFFSGEDPLWRFSVKSTAPPADLPGTWLIDWGGAQRWYRGAAALHANELPALALPDMEKIATQANGQVSLFRGGDRSGEVFHHQPPALQAIQQRIKQAVDPDALFNPGRLYSWL